MPRSKNFLYFSGALAGSVCTAPSITAPVTPLAVKSSAGGMAWIFAGPKLPPLQKAATAAQPAGVPNPAASLAAWVARRLSSLGSATHFSAACKAAAMGGGGLAPAKLRAHRHAHHTASRF